MEDQRVTNQVSQRKKQLLSAAPLQEPPSSTIGWQGGVDPDPDYDVASPDKGILDWDEKTRCLLGERKSDGPS
ncbi:MAG TPA: hypothetical protein DEP84_10710 [Chloroflexi bacterium]|nr:hypothetical protein [Chloroflexota bacterium]